MVTVSVIVPVYNVEKYLHRCVDSILAQTFTDFELILVDDGSPDCCGAICDEYAEIDSRVHVIHQVNGGLSAARNAGIDWAFVNSTSSWLTFIDSDDWVHPQYLEILMQAVRVSGNTISMCRYIKTKVQRRAEKQELVLKLATPGGAYTYNSELFDAYAWGRLYAKECFSEIRYPTGRIYEDVATTYKLLYAQNQISIAENTLYYYYLRSDSITQLKWCKEKMDYLYACEEQIPFLDECGDTFVSERVKRAYTENLLGQFYQAEESEYSDEEKREICTELRIKLRKALKDYRNAVSASVKDTPWYYEVAYPKLMFIYWTFKAQLDKLRRK